MEGYSVFPAESEFCFIEDIKKQMHPEVLKLYPSAELPHLKSEIKSKKICEIINNPVGLILNSHFLSSSMY